jgi:hypothetical protein
MPYPIFPVSPLPANIDRNAFWKVDKVKYDSGARQAMSTFVRPLYRYRIPIPVYNEIKQSSLMYFWNQVKGETLPFFMKDPYDYWVNSAIVVRSGLISAATIYMYDANSFKIYPDTTTVGSLFSSLSGYVTAGSEYNIEQDTGILRVNTKATTDVWRVTSIQYFRKCALEQTYNERAIIWNIFGTELTVEEFV